MEKNVRIYTVFSMEGTQPSSQTYSLYHPEEKVLTNREIMKIIKEKCDGIEFIGKTEPEDIEYTIGIIKGLKNTLDGLLYFGPVPDELLQLDIPTIAIHPLWGRWQYPFHSYKNYRVLTDCFPIIPDSSEETFNSRIDKIVKRIKIIQSISKMKGLKILIITDKPILGEYEPTPFQFEDEGREKYEEKYIKNLSELGAGIIVRPQKEMVERMKKADPKKAKEIGEKWIEEAAGIKGTNKEEIEKSAKLYLAMKEMLELYNADAITTEGYGVFISYPEGPIPSQGMPSSQFCTDGIVATSETLVDSLITQQIGLWITGSTGFNGDYVIDEETDIIYIGHCECPFNPYGDERKAPYIIRNLPQYPVDQQEKGGACAQVLLPIGEKVTIAKFSIHDKKLSIFTGETVDGEKLFPGFNDILCRTKLAIRTDAKKLLERVDWKTFGVHRVAFFGNWKEEFKDAAKLMGFEVIEKDK